MQIPVSGPVNLTGKTAIVTGAARGIGQAICLSLAREGARVAAFDVLSSTDTVKSIEATGKDSLGISCDVNKQKSVQQAVDRVIKEWGHIDVLVNNAAVLGDYGKPFEQYSLDEWDLLLRTNLRGVFLLTKAVWPYLRKQGGGKVVCIGSVAGKIGGLFAGPHYCASKGGIHAFVKWAAKHGAKFAIHVNGVAPGAIVTAMTINEPSIKNEMIPLGRLGRPEDVAEAVLFLSSQASNFITGCVIDVNGGLLMT